MTKPPIAALNIAVEATEMLYGGERWVADAREALAEVEALVAAVRRRPCQGVARDGHEDECLTTDAPIGVWCWRCTALAKFTVKAGVGQPECPSCAVTLGLDTAHAGDCEYEGVQS